MKRSEVVMWIAENFYDFNTKPLEAIEKADAKLRKLEEDEKKHYNDWFAITKVKLHRLMLEGWKPEDAKDD